MSGADWSMFHGNAQHTGAAKDTLDAGLSLNWTSIGHRERFLPLPLRLQTELSILVHVMKMAMYNHAIHAVDLKYWQIGMAGSSRCTSTSVSSCS